MFSVDELHCMVDIHLHLDGAISPESAKQLAEAQGITIPESEEELLSLLRVTEKCGDLREFLEKFSFPCLLLQTAPGVQMAVRNLLNELEAQGVMYAEVRFSPQKCTDMGITQEEAVRAAIDGMREANIDANLILCCMRGDGNHAENVETIRLAEKYLGRGVAAVDLAGSEAQYPNADYADVFALAAQKGIPYTIHAGEAAGPESVWKALEMGAQRIGHGVRAVEDAALLRELQESQIPLGLCPTSNLFTAVYPDIREWPLRRLMEAGVCITINTDDPAIEGTTIKEEYQKLIDAFGIGKEEVKTFLKNTVNASFTDDALKQKLLRRIDEEIPD